MVDSSTLGFVIGDTLSDRLFTSSSANSDSKDNEALLGLVTKAASFVWASWAGNTVHNGELSVFPTPHSEKKSHDIRLLLSP